ncbi:MAG: heavy-metal-associated domain-containing protein [Nitrospirae bacterium]|nr:heavy-metal-associated domain-containing protein [Nitrospirota bacterium]
MKTSLFSVNKNICAECSLALRRFIGGLDGDASIDAQQGRIAVTFDESVLPEETIVRITKESIEKLGYRVEE